MANYQTSLSKFQEILRKAKEKINEEEGKRNIDNLSNQVAAEKPQVIDFSKTGCGEDEEAVVDFVTEISSALRSLVKEGKEGSGVSRSVILNREQQAFVDLLCKEKDCVLIGAAGTGKTTCTGAAIKALLKEELIPNLQVSTKSLSAGTPGILVCSFTRKAVNNIRRALPEELKANALTLHKVLEFGPVFYDQWNEEKKEVVRTMRFEPFRTKTNPLPESLLLAIFEESSMIGTDLYKLWKDATPHFPQEVFIGDIQQLPPVFGSAILGFKMALLPVVELTEVYRQALDSPIISLAHAILSGDPYKFDKTITLEDTIHPETNKKVTKKVCPGLKQWEKETVINGVKNTLKIQIWQKSLDPETACDITIQQFKKWSEPDKNGEQYYNPAEDIIICPFGIATNKKGNATFGAERLNRGILDFLSQQRGEPTHEIIAGFNKHYYAIGDRVLYDKEDAEIIDIKRNRNYYGKSPAPPSLDLTREGIYRGNSSSKSTEKSDKAQEEDLENFLLSALSDKDTELEEEGRVRAASHTITLRFCFNGQELELSSAADINNLSGGHAMTVHKLQGSENEKVFLVLHKSHAVMVQRELLYTAVTRARSFLHIICENDSFFNGVKSQSVKGTTLAEKIETFKGKSSFLQMKEEMDLFRYQELAKEQLKSSKLS